MTMSHSGKDKSRNWPSQKISLKSCDGQSWGLCNCEELHIQFTLLDRIELGGMHLSDQAEILINTREVSESYVGHLCGDAAWSHF